MTQENKDITIQNSNNDYPEQLKTRAREFFAKAAQVGYALQYDYAIELYLDGLSFWPDAVEEGHKPLREIALRRKAAGGKKSGFTDGSKYKKASGKHPKDAMLKAEYLLSKDPTNINHMTDMAKAATQAGYSQTTLWICDIIFDFNLQQKKPSFQIYMLLKTIYSENEEYSRALQACQLAAQLKPNDHELLNTIRDLSAQQTLKQGKYESAEDFRDSIKNKDEQEKLHDQEKLVRTEQVVKDAIAEARREYEQEPLVSGKIIKLVNALCETEQDQYENEAMDILAKAYAQTKEFHHEQLRGEILIKQIKRHLRNLTNKLKVSPDDTQLAEQITDTRRKLLEAELNHFHNCVKNYPTDMRFKYEYGQALLRAKRYDDAIPVFQEARNDPRSRIAALNGIGRCFFYKGWYPDAAETFGQALSMLDDKEGPAAKELLYNLARSYEKEGNIEQALQNYRRVVQIDFNYRDAKQRVDTLRKKQNENK